MLQFTPHQQCISETTKLFEAKQYIISHMNDSGSYDSLVHGFFRWFQKINYIGWSKVHCLIFNYSTSPNIEIPVVNALISYHMYNCPYLTYSHVLQWRSKPPTIDNTIIMFILILLFISCGSARMCLCFSFNIYDKFYKLVGYSANSRQEATDMKDIHWHFEFTWLLTVKFSHWLYSSQLLMYDTNHFGIQIVFVSFILANFIFRKYANL